MRGEAQPGLNANARAAIGRAPFANDATSGAPTQRFPRARRREGHLERAGAATQGAVLARHTFATLMLSAGKDIGGSQSAWAHGHPDGDPAPAPNARPYRHDGSLADKMVSGQE